jgi:chemotaxis protein methyltransferase CheR
MSGTSALLAEAGASTAYPGGFRREYTFTGEDFTRICLLIHRYAGISLTDQKRDMVYGRLARRLRTLGLDSFRDYLDRLEANRHADEWQAFTNALTTNLTSFFREAHHFPLLAEFARQRGAPLSVWCAAASSGEEPYSIAMTLVEALGEQAARACSILATDLDTDMLAHAAAGIYRAEQVRQVSPERLRRFFLKGTGGQAGRVKVRPELRAQIRFAQNNLVAADYGIAERFDVIFCRNVMIYFDKATQTEVLSRFAQRMKPDGLLFAGHSENFTYLTQAFRLRGQTVYEFGGGKPALERAS